jgi:hypothetical protein
MRLMSGETPSSTVSIDAISAFQPRSKKGSHTPPATTLGGSASKDENRVMTHPVANDVGAMSRARNREHSFGSRSPASASSVEKAHFTRHKPAPYTSRRAYAGLWHREEKAQKLALAPMWRSRKATT